MEDMGVLGALEASVALEDCTEEACMELAMVTVRYILATSDNDNNQLCFDNDNLTI